MTTPPSEQSKKQGLLLKQHRKTVNASKSMSAGILLGSSFAVAVGGLGWLGHRWDEKTGREPLGVLIGVGLGFGYGAYEVWKLVRAGNREAAESDAKKAESVREESP